MKKLSTEYWIQQAKEVHGEKFNYSLTLYTTAKTKLKIICSVHGEQEMLPHHHIKGYGCGKCGKEQINISNGKQFTQELFLNKASLVNENLSFERTIYKSKRKNIIVTCRIHGDYVTKAEMILKSCGCPKCKSSKGEDIIETWLLANNIEYVTQKTFKECVYEKQLKFDFYLPTLNMCIEFDGEQHFKPIKYWGGIMGFKKLIIKDTIKNEFCKNKNISLLRISHKDNVVDVLKKQFSK